jgi:hypothetical protein
MKYLDNLIAWGDHLFRQATRETIAEALQIYVLAWQILGPRPVRLEARTPDDRSFHDLEDDLDAFSNALVDLENLMPSWRFLWNENITFKAVDTVEHPELKLTLPVPPPEPSDGFVTSISNGSAGLEPDIMLMNTALNIGNPQPERALYFCIPPNEKMLGYWDAVEDRLFKIRNCLDIEGVRLELPLFQPPIDPALLVKAAAAGIDLASAIAALNAPRPHYRFRAVVPVAKELAAEVRSLGQALLTALERKDAEALAELRATHEVRTVEVAERVLEERVREARESVASLRTARRVAEHRRDHFEKLLEEPVLEMEHEALFWSRRADGSYFQAIGDERQAAEKAQIPDFGLIVGLSPAVSTTIGGTLLSIQHASDSRVHTHNAAKFGLRTSAMLTEAGFEVRGKQWDLELEQAMREIDRIDQEIVAAEVRVEIAARELETHRQEIAQARERETFLQQRFTRSELYGWMASEVGRVYHQAYQLAYDVAKRAERTYQFELAAEDTSFIQFGYWDNQRKGLLAGDRLLHDIRRMETAHLQNHRRELELTKNVSLATLDPMALTLLRETGECYLRVPELLFDLDHPGHFLRRLKSVSVSVPSKTGQLAEVPLTLTLVSSSIRKSTAVVGAPPAPAPDALVDDLTAGIQQISTLSAEEDDGLFERNFNDERYLPFEGRGAVGLWRIELPQTFRQFDYGLIGDVVLRLSFTARQGGDAFKNAVRGEIEQVIQAYERDAPSFGKGLVTAISVKQTYPDAWSRFVDPPDEEEPKLELDVSAQRFPLAFRDKPIEATKLWLLAVFEDAGSAVGTLEFEVDLPGTGTFAQNPVLNSSMAGVDRIRMTDSDLDPVAIPGAWNLELQGSPPEVPEGLEDLVLVVQYFEDEE